MTRQNKVNTILDDISRSEAERLVADVLAEIPSEMEADRDVRLEDLRPYYASSQLDSAPHPWLTGPGPISNLPIVGSVERMKGSILITQNGAAYQYIDLKRVVGYKIVPDEHAQATTQSGLLEFLG